MFVRPVGGGPSHVSLPEEGRKKGGVSSIPLTLPLSICIIPAAMKPNFSGGGGGMSLACRCVPAQPLAWWQAGIHRSSEKVPKAKAYKALYGIWEEVQKVETGSSCLGLLERFCLCHVLEGFQVEKDSWGKPHTRKCTCHDSGMLFLLFSCLFCSS